jgi:hypothetical protein
MTPAPHANWTSVIVFSIVLAGLVAALWLYAGYRRAVHDHAVTNPGQIAQFCHALHAPDPAVTQDCLTHAVLTHQDLREYCLVHAHMRPGIAGDALGNCLVRVRRLLEAQRLALPGSP